MHIDKEKMLKILWYEDENGELIDCDPDVADPEGALYRVTRFPLMIRTTHNKIIKQENVDKCTHDRKYITRLYDCIDEFEERTCNCCGGTQIRKKGSTHWPKRWQAHGSRVVVEFNSTANDEETIMGMVNSGDFTLSEALIAYSEACERCMNVLAYKYTDGKDGYPEFSDEWKKAGTFCKFCKDDGYTRPYNNSTDSNCGCEGIN